MPGCTFHIPSTTVVNLSPVLRWHVEKPTLAGSGASKILGTKGQLPSTIASSLPVVSAPLL